MKFDFRCDSILTKQQKESLTYPHSRKQRKKSLASIPSKALDRFSNISNDLSKEQAGNSVCPSISSEVSSTNPSSDSNVFVGGIASQSYTPVDSDIEVMDVSPPAPNIAKTVSPRFSSKEVSDGEIIDVDSLDDDSELESENSRNIGRRKRSKSVSFCEEIAVKEFQEASPPPEKPQQKEEDSKRRSLSVDEGKTENKMKKFSPKDEKPPRKHKRRSKSNKLSPLILSTFIQPCSGQHENRADCLAYLDQFMATVEPGELATPKLCSYYRRLQAKGKQEAIKPEVATGNVPGIQGLAIEKPAEPKVDHIAEFLKECEDDVIEDGDSQRDHMISLMDDSAQREFSDSSIEELSVDPEIQVVFKTKKQSKEIGKNFPVKSSDKTSKKKVEIKNKDERSKNSKTDEKSNHSAIVASMESRDPRIRKLNSKKTKNDETIPENVDSAAEDVPESPDSRR